MAGMRDYSDAELDLVRKSFGGRYALRDRCYFEMALQMGLRVSEMLSLTVGQVFQYNKGVDEVSIERSLDYLVRVSDKAHYVGPSRGQLGNALKCVWAAPYVARGEQGAIEVVTRGHTAPHFGHTGPHCRIAHPASRDGARAICKKWDPCADTLATDSQLPALRLRRPF